MTVQFTARLEDQLHRILKRLAKDSGNSVNGELNKYLRMGLTVEARRRKLAQQRGE